MKIFRRRKKQQQQEPISHYVDFDRKHIVLNDSRDATSIYTSLVMKYGASTLGLDQETGCWTVHLDGLGHWTGTSQWEALTAAWTDLEGRRPDGS